MGVLVYTARRSLITGHTAFLPYGMDVAVQDAVRSHSVQKTAVRSLGGAIEILRNYSDAEWRITFEPLSGIRFAQMREFLDSTDGGEVFSLDMYGSGTPLSLRRTDDGHTETPFMRLGSSVSDVFTAAITAIEA